MNYFAHALPFLVDGDPYFTVGTGVPDWLSVVDRKVRVRRKYTEAFEPTEDGRLTAAVQGIDQHLRDDARFHQSRAFVEVSLKLTVMARDCLAGETGFRPSFLGHLLTEVLLDNSLIEANPGKLETYYQVLGSIDPMVVEEAVNCLAPRKTDRLAWMISRFRDARVLSDYSEDAKLMIRLDQVMRRVGCDELPSHFAEILPEARRRVDQQRDALMDGIPDHKENAK